MKRIFFVAFIGLLFPTIGSSQNTRIKERLEQKYYFVNYDKESGYYRVSDNNWNEGLCDANGREVIEPQFKSVLPKKVEGKYVFRVELSNGRMGYYNKDGKEFIPPIYTYAYYNEIEERFDVQDGDKVGWIDKTGKVLFPPKYSQIWFNETANMYQVKDGIYVGYCDANKTEVIAPNKYTQVIYFTRENVFLISLGDKSGLCDSLGHEVVEPKYDAVSRIKECEFHGERYWVKLNGKIGILANQGKVVVPIVHDSLYYAGEGLCKAKDKKWGYLSAKDGTNVIPFIYDKVSDFKDGVAKVTKDGQTTLLVNPIKAVADNNQPKVKGKVVSTYPAPDSDVDKTIPNGKKADGNTHAFIMANENYPEAKVPYALNDGWSFEKYCKQTLGIKEENVHLFEDATGGNIVACVEQMKQVANSADGNATIIFYYAGHAFPDEEKSTAYLMPVDGDSKNPATGYSLEKLYKELNSVQTKQVVCFLDACFSGATRDDQMLIAGRGVAIKVKDEIPQGNMVVMTSATGAETAHSYEEMHHGLFTYYLLHKLQETNGDVTLGELSEYVTKMVKRKSVLINQKKQTPTVIPSPQQQGTWQNIRL